MAIETCRGLIQGTISVILTRRWDRVGGSEIYFRKRGNKVCLWIRLVVVLRVRNSVSMLGNLYSEMLTLEKKNKNITFQLNKS